MKKGSKLSDINYSVEIRDLDRAIPITASSSSLRELLRVVAEYVPTMDNYSKVYRDMRLHVGVYMGLFTLPLPGKKHRQVVVTIMSDTTTEADIERFHAYAATLPRFGPPDTPESDAATIEELERLDKGMKPRSIKRLRQ